MGQLIQGAGHTETNTWRRSCAVVPYTFVVVYILIYRILHRRSTCTFRIVPTRFTSILTARVPFQIYQGLYRPYVPELIWGTPLEWMFWICLPKPHCFEGRIPNHCHLHPTQSNYSLSETGGVPPAIFPHSSFSWVLKTGFILFTSAPKFRKNDPV